MDLSSNITRCHPFSDTLYVEAGSKQECCTNMNLVSATLHSIQCYTCKVRKCMPSGVKPILTCDKKVLSHHTVNNHILICNICSQIIQPELTSHEKVNDHVTQCVIRSTYNTSRPYICTSLS